MRSRLTSAYSAKMSKNGTRLIVGGAGEAFFGIFNGLHVLGAFVVISVSLRLMFTYTLRNKLVKLLVAGIVYLFDDCL